MIHPAESLTQGSMRTSLEKGWKNSADGVTHAALGSTWLMPFVSPKEVLKEAATKLSLRDE